MVADSDYVAVSDNTLMFPMNSVDGATQCMDITITNDDVFELNETFTVTLTVNTASVIADMTMTEVTITDNDGWLKHGCLNSSCPRAAPSDSRLFKPSAYV